MKGIELTPIQIKAKDSGATLFMFPIPSGIFIKQSEDEFLSAKELECPWCEGKDPYCSDCYGNGTIWDIDCESKEQFIAKYSPIQKCDKDIYVKEPYFLHGAEIWYVNDCDEETINQADYNVGIINTSQMAKEQSRYSFSECIDVSVIKVYDIDIEDWFRIGVSCPAETECMNYYNRQMQEQGLPNTYDQDVKDGKYIFLAKLK